MDWTWFAAGGAAYLLATGKLGGIVQTPPQLPVPAPQTNPYGFPFWNQPSSQPPTAQGPSPAQTVSDVAKTVGQVANVAKGIFDFFNPPK